MNFKSLAITALLATGLVPALSPGAEPLPVVTSFSILGDLVQVVAGERVKVITLVGPDADAHTFEPTPQHAKTVLHSRLFVINGLNFEPWAQKLAKSANYRGQILVVSQGIKVRSDPAQEGQRHSHAEADPHGWQDPNNVMVYVKNTAKSPASVDPTGADSYQTNSEAYLKELAEIDQLANSQFAAIPLAKRQVIRQIKRDKIKPVFVENMTTPSCWRRSRRTPASHWAPSCMWTRSAAATSPVQAISK